MRLVAPRVIKVVCTSHYKALCTASCHFFGVQPLELGRFWLLSPPEHTHGYVTAPFRYRIKGQQISRRSKASGMSIWHLVLEGVEGGSGLSERALSFTVLEQIEPELAKTEAFQCLQLTRVQQKPLKF